ncbi:type IV pili methyl-accepting chemotaxis transducer N-terminal domain-containing protein [Pleionea sediminis]|uniref:type IV pili methyl-accepting chemotaxis transducer N-terminal domain-containing protein n=1 Tax=Pleionea sediminis TaxID=2569479 RepID=UPI0011872561|nr:type IV pili methyl-accepting chemotaxis transducer N-terminal domain-containing protein [Pleionea sediminis]
MFKRIQDSIIFRIGTMMSLLIALALSSMISSFLISEMADNDAAAVNLSGSLRMQSYKMLNNLVIQSSDSNKLEVFLISLEKFERSLNSPTLKLEVYKSSESEISNQYEKVKKLWNDRFKPALIKLEEGALDSKDSQIIANEFVEQVDLLVSYYQSEAERKIRLLRLIQVIALFSTFVLVYFALTSLRRTVEFPLHELTQSARKISGGDFTAQVNVKNSDELGILADTINKMSGALSQMYGKLEKRVEEKTFELQRSRNALEFLLNASKEITAKKSEEMDFELWTDHLSKITQLKSIDLCLTTADGTQPFLHVLTDLECHNPECKPVNCATCLEGAPFTGELPVISFQLKKNDINYGVLTCTLQPNEKLELWQEQILESFSDLVALSLSFKNQADQERRMALMTERTTIARELHDSLAQALSYLKIQVTRLKRAVAKDGQEMIVAEVIEELQEGLNSAYRQLRELLTTFRLQLSGVGLQSALDETVEQFKEQRPEFTIKLQYKVSNVPFTPNEEIHLLQLVREATQNAIHHSQGNQVTIEFKQGEQKDVELSIIDNGIGIPESPEKVNHYGLAIMQERGRNLNGSLKIQRLNQGTGVFFKFLPSYLRS